MSGATVAVVGGTGFLGRHIRTRLAAAGTPALSVARRPAGDAPSVALDLRTVTSGELADVLIAHRATAVVNAAGAVWDYDERQLAELNVLLVENLRDAVAKVPWPVRVVQLGTVFEYARPRQGEYLTEESPTEPATSYGSTKLRGSEIVLAATRAGLLDGVVLRPTTCVGPQMPRASLLGRVSAELRDAAGRRDTAVLRLAPLTAARDVVDCRDLADAVLDAVRAPAGPLTGQVINIGRGEAVGVRRLVDLLVAASGVPTTLVEDEAQTGRSAGIDWLAVGIGRAERLLGWSPRRSLASTAEAMWRQVITDAEGRA